LGRNDARRKGIVSIMAEYSLEQKRAIALASARARLKAQEQSPEQPAEQPITPGSQSLDYGDMIKGGLFEVGKGFIKGGPLGGITAGMSEGIKNFGALTERAGYRSGEAVTDALAPHVPAEVAGAAGYATNVGVQAIPTLVGASLGGQAGKTIGQSAGKSVMQSALKPPKADILSGDADKAVKTMLEKGINVSRAGIFGKGGDAKLQGLANDLNAEVKRLISTSSDTVTKSNAAKEIYKIIKVFRNQANPSSDIRAIVRSWDEFNKVTPNSIPIQMAQDLKQGTYAALKNKAFSGELKNADIEAQKALARGLKQSIEQKVPSVAPVNKELGEIINALRMVENRAGMAGNLNLAGLSGAAMNPKVAALMMADRSSVLKSLLARSLYSGGGAAGTAIGGTAGAVYSNQNEQAPLAEAVKSRASRR